MPSSLSGRSCSLSILPYLALFFVVLGKKFHLHCFAGHPCVCVLLPQPGAREQAQRQSPGDACIIPEGNRLTPLERVVAEWSDKVCVLPRVFLLAQ